MLVIFVHSFLHLSSVRVFLFVHAGLLPFLLDYLHTSKSHSWACRRRSMKINQLSWTPLQNTLLWNFSKLMTEQSCSVEVLGWESVIWLYCLLSGSWTSLFTVTVVKVIPEICTPKNSSFSVNTRFSRLPVPFWNLSHLCQKGTVSTFWKPTGLCFAVMLVKLLKIIYIVLHLFLWVPSEPVLYKVKPLQAVG